MDIKQHTTPEKLERYSFLWSEVRLLIAALALFLGGIPPLLYFVRVAGLYNFLSMFLNLAWIVSGLASGYLIYLWYQRKTLFGGTVKRDLYAFLIMVVSGINLGLTGILKTNIGMSIIYNHAVFVLVGILYLLAAYHLYTRWKANGERVF